MRNSFAIPPLPLSAVTKHDHLGAALVKARERRELASGSKVLCEIETIAAKTAQLYDTALQLVQEARDAKDRPQALLAMDRAIALLREARANAGLVATLTGEINQPGAKGDQVAILVYPPVLPPGAPCDLSHRPAVYPDRENICIAPAVSPETILEDEEPAA